MAVGHVVTIVPALSLIVISLMLGITRLAKPEATALAAAIVGAATVWMIVATRLWWRWAAKLAGVDHRRVKRLARATGLISRKLQ